ncbi:MAG: tRNA uridine-5-carboxymethylaminomethyl(34) synthesis GTPase MnmE [Smithellaceae bacterium]
MTHTDTIAAIATPHGTASTGLIRVSGPEAGELAKQLFRPSRPGCEWLSHHLYHGDLLAGDGITLLDEALVTLMRGPHSFTGEDVLEISCHGNPLILKSILERLMELGCRPARPGEFTQRAFLNGRMDLSQAEALATLICAQSEKARRIGLEQLKGSLGCRIGELRSMLIDAMAMLEVLIDFGEDVPPEDVPKPQMLIAQARKEFESLLSTCRQAKFITAGFEAIIIGKPNVGKSSLLNALAGKKKAIVTDIPGTTRDLITETIDINGLVVRLTDTAGLRDPQDAIEKEGIDLVLENLELADAVLIVLDGSKPLTSEDMDILKRNKNYAQRAVIAVNKCDLPPAWTPRQLPEPYSSGVDILSISAKFGDGLDGLKKKLANMAGHNEQQDGSVIITQLRHKLSLEKALARAGAAVECLEAQQSPEFAAFELHQAIEALDEITGKVIQDDVLDKIFSTFCIGK